MAKNKTALEKYIQDMEDKITVSKKMLSRKDTTVNQSAELTKSLYIYNELLDLAVATSKSLAPSKTAVEVK